MQPVQTNPHDKRAGQIHGAFCDCPCYFRRRWMGKAEPARFAGKPRLFARSRRTSKHSPRLELVSQRELKDAWIARRRQSAKGSRAEGRGNPVEVCVVENVKGFRPELQLVPFRNVKVLVDGHIEVHQSGSINAAGRGVPEITSSRRAKGSGVKPLLHGFWTHDGLAGHIRTIR